MTAVDTDQGWVPSADSFGARLALVRNHLGLNVKAAAERAGLDHSSWGTWERGRQPRDLVDKARQISRTLGCDFLWLLTGSAESGKVNQKYLSEYLSGYVRKHPNMPHPDVSLNVVGFIPAA